MRQQRQPGQDDNEQAIHQTNQHDHRSSQVTAGGGVYDQHRAGVNEDTEEVTSASVPTHPLWIFFSRKASIHLPPDVVGAKPSARFLAENFYHEAVHQLVNAHLLFGRLVPEDFSSETSPKIPISWRATASPRNREWEIDRVLHAAVVYESMIGYRAAQLTDPTIHPWERAAFEEANAIAVPNLSFLATSLRQHTGALTDEGAEVARHLSGVASSLTA